MIAEIVQTFWDFALIQRHKRQKIVPLHLIRFLFFFLLFHFFYTFLMIAHLLHFYVKCACMTASNGKVALTRI